MHCFCTRIFFFIKNLARNFQVLRAQVQPLVPTPLSHLGAYPLPCDPNLALCSDLPCQIHLTSSCKCKQCFLAEAGVSCVLLQSLISGFLASLGLTPCSALAPGSLPPRKPSPTIPYPYLSLTEPIGPVWHYSNSDCHSWWQRGAWGVYRVLAAHRIQGQATTALSFLCDIFTSLFNYRPQADHTTLIRP